MQSMETRSATSNAISLSAKFVNQRAELVKSVALTAVECVPHLLALGRREAQKLVAVRPIDDMAAAA